MLANDTVDVQIIHIQCVLTNESGLDNVDTSNTVDSADLVSLLEDLERSSDGLACNLELDGNTLLEVNNEGGGLIGGLHGVLRWVLASTGPSGVQTRLTNSALPHVLGGLKLGLLENLEWSIWYTEHLRIAGKLTPAS